MSEELSDALVHGPDRVWPVWKKTNNQTNKKKEKQKTTIYKSSQSLWNEECVRG